MKKYCMTLIVLLGVALSASAQLIPRAVLHEFGVRESDNSYLIITPSLSHNLSEASLSSEVGVSVGVESIANKSTLSVGYTYRRYFVNDVNPNFHSVELNSSVYPIEGFGLGLRMLSNLRKGEFYDEQLSIGKDILDACGLVIGKEDDTRGLSNRSKLFGTLGLIYKVDQNFRVETVVMVNDYDPHAWAALGKSPYKNTIKVGLSYTIPIFEL